MNLVPATILQAPMQPPVRVQGSPMFLCVYVDVQGDLVTIPLEVAGQVADAIRDQARLALQGAREAS